MTTLSGILRDSGGNPITGSLWLELSQAGTYNPGAILLAPEPPTVFILTNGQITGPGGGPYSVYGNDGITPDVTFYKLTAFDTSGQQVLRANVLFTGASADLGALDIAPTQDWTPPVPGGSGVTDGNKGDISVTGSGATWTVNPSAITTTKMGGDVTTPGKALLTAADAATQKSLIGAIGSDDVARTIVKKNGTAIGTRRAINFIEGANVTLTIADDAGNEEVDVTVASSGGGGGAGSGTVGKIPKWTTTSTLTDSVLAESSGGIGLGVTASLLGMFHILGTTSTQPLVLEAVGSSSQPFSRMLRANGTPGSKTAVANADYIGGFQFQGYNGSAYQTASGGALACIASENWNSTNNGCEVVLIVTQNTTASAMEGLRVKQDGSIQIKSGPRIISGTGSPEGVVTATVGSVFLRTNGGASTTLYVKESGTGNTGWVAK